MVLCAPEDTRQRLIDIFVNSVYVYDDHAVVTFDYKDSAVTITLKDIEGAGLGSSLSLLGAPKKPWLCSLLRFFH